MSQETTKGEQVQISPAVVITGSPRSATGSGHMSGSRVIAPMPRTDFDRQFPPKLLRNMQPGDKRLQGVVTMDRNAPKEWPVVGKILGRYFDFVDTPKHGETMRQRAVDAHRAKLAGVVLAGVTVLGGAYALNGDSAPEIGPQPGQTEVQEPVEIKTEE